MRRDFPGASLILGDSFALAEDLPRVDLILTDPPFSAAPHALAKSNRDKGHGNSTIDFEHVEYADLARLFATLGGKCDRWLVAFMDWRHIALIEREPIDPWEFVRFGVWVKANPMPQISCDRPANGWDGILYMHNRASRKEWHGGGAHGNFTDPIKPDGVHPTPKPVRILERIIARHSNPGDLVLDPFMGGGSTAIAALSTGRRFLGIERDPKYFNASCERVEAFQRQGTLAL